MLQDSIDKEFQQTILISFNIDENGNVADVKLAEPQNAHPKLIEESIRIISNSPLWIPAKQNGKKIKSTLKQAVSWRFGGIQ